MEDLIFYLLVALGVFFSSCSQILLKKSAQRVHSKQVYEMLNVQVVFAYSIFLISVVINVIALANGVRVKDLPVLETLGYIFVPILSLFFLKERLTLKRLVALVIILLGIIIFYL